MGYQIFVERQPHNGFVAVALGWPDYVRAGETKDEAVNNVQAAVAARLAQGEVVCVQVEAPPRLAVADPWEAMIGSCLDDPAWDAYQAELRRIRAEANRVIVADNF